MSEIRVDNITDEAGTGKPGFPNGITATGAALTDPEITGGIYLGGTGSANYLDDYEEGTWTPDPIGSSGTPGSYSLSIFGTPLYTKIGRIVTVTASFSVTDVGSYTGQFRIFGLPFTVSDFGDNNMGVNGTVRAQNVSYSSGAYVTIEGFRNETYARLQATRSASGNNPVNYTELNNDAYFTITMTYPTDS